MFHHNIPLSEEASETKRRWTFQRIWFNGRIHVEDEREGKQGKQDFWLIHPEELTDEQPEFLQNR